MRHTRRAGGEADGYCEEVGGGTGERPQARSDRIEQPASSTVSGGGMFLPSSTYKD